MQRSAGTTLGTYVIVALSGRGMGEVYRARDARPGREIAAKTLPELGARVPVGQP